jgi:hypothetical protein
MKLYFQSARSSAALFGATPTSGHIETRTQGRSTEPHCGAAPWVTLTDVFGLVAGVTPVREPIIGANPFYRSERQN